QSDIVLSSMSATTPGNSSDAQLDVAAQQAEPATGDTGSEADGAEAAADEPYAEAEVPIDAASLFTDAADFGGEAGFAFAAADLGFEAMFAGTHAMALPGVQHIV
ncbi:MAG: hypothetical protein ACRCUI_04855, partial [Polymorphobacter sp.]